MYNELKFLIEKVISLKKNSKTKIYFFFGKIWHADVKRLVFPVTDVSVLYFVKATPESFFPLKILIASETDLSSIRLMTLKVSSSDLESSTKSVILFGSLPGIVLTSFSLNFPQFRNCYVLIHIQEMLHFYALIMEFPFKSLWSLDANFRKEITS